ncbi:hypothetical protein IAT38_000856 [Cryptococcus sp. DSM 104549]
MAPTKRAGRQSTPPPKKKTKRSNGPSAPAQTSIASFFASPSKPKPPATTSARNNGVITIDDSDEEVVRETSVDGGADADEVLARKLAAEWAKEDGAGGSVAVVKSASAASPADKGKGKAAPIETITIEDDGNEDDDVQAVDAPHVVINGSSSSSHTLPRAKPVKPANAVNAVKAEQDIKPAFPSPSKGKAPAITSTAAESVAPIDFDMDPFVFSPAEIDASQWPKGRLPYSILVGVYVQVSSTRSRLAIIRILTNFLHLVLHTSPIDLPPSLYLLSNHLLPSYIPCDLGIGSSILTKAIQEVSGLQPRDLKRLWQKHGDPGDVAFEAKSNLRTLVRPAPLMVGDVYTKLLGLTKVKGSASGKVKGDTVRKLMVQARGEEVRFLVRSLIGNLRIGAVRLTLLTALARATTLYHLSPTLRSSILPLPLPPAPTPTSKGKRLPKPRPVPDPARTTAEALCISAIRSVRQAYVRHPNYTDLIRGLASGVDGLADRVGVSVGIPLSPMLGSITRSLGEVFTRLGSLPFTAEAKLDGQRVQIHARLDGPQGEEDGGGRWVEGESGDRVWVRLFSRHLEEMTEKYPDVAHLVQTLLTRPVPSSPTPFPSTASPPSQRVIDLLHAQSITSFVIDAEIVAVDKATGAFRTFQELSNRAKKDVKVEDIKVVVGVFAFDLMVLNDVPLLDAPFSHRRHLLRTLLPPCNPTPTPSAPAIAHFTHVESIDSSTLVDAPAELQAFFEKVVEGKCEGLMVKLLESGEGLVGEDAEGDEGEGEVEDGDEGGEDEGKKKGNKRKPLPATYEPDQRSQGWLKVKKDYLEGLGDSLDLVPIGAWWGQGRKAGWWSPILLACHNPESGALEAVCKCISGFTDAFYKDLIKRYPPEGLPEKCNKTTPLGYYETNGLTPNVWFEPGEVWEIRGADITLSPVYPAAASLLGSERGLSIRFPRFIRVREDKSWEQATTSEQFAEMYRKQAGEGGGAGPGGGGAEQEEGDDDE